MQASEHKNASEAPDEMQRFKKFIFELSARLISLPANQIDAEIYKRLELIGEFRGFDQIVLTELSDDEKEIRTNHSYASPGVKHPPLTISKDRIPWLMEKLLNGETVSLSRLPDALPEAAIYDRDFCIAGGIKSAIVLPLKVGELVGEGFFWLRFEESVYGIMNW